MKFIDFRIEFWGMASMISLFLSFWIRGRFWSFFSTGILLMVMAILEHNVKKQRSKK